MKEPVLLFDGYVRFFIEEDFASRHNTSLDRLEEYAGIPISLIDELSDISEKEFDLRFDSDNLDIRIDRADDVIVMDIIDEGESNITYLENDYITEENIVDGWTRIFNYLPDENIDLGIMFLDKRREMLHKLRTDREYLREYLKEKGII
nr:MAG TPA: hypothetical protein [Caudoviricetes sp.]